MKNISGLLRCCFLDGEIEDTSKALQTNGAILCAVNVLVSLSSQQRLLPAGCFVNNVMQVFFVYIPSAPPNIPLKVSWRELSEICSGPPYEHTAVA